MRAALRPPSFEVPLLCLTNPAATLYSTLVTGGAHKEGIMTCTRCQGCMAKDYFLDLMESAESMWLVGWRCLNCGNVLDPVMERNRLGQGIAAGVSTARV
jgi:hypothetical protein